MEVDLFDFVEQCRHLIKQALGKHVVLHCLRLEDGHSYRETPNPPKYMAEIRDTFDLDRDDLPDYSMVYKSFDRLKCGCGGHCLAFQRSNTRSLATHHSTARSSTAAQPRRTTVSGREVG